MNRPRMRDDLALSEGYHSPQVDVRVRLNTNEAPLPPPERFVEAVSQAVHEIAWHRYPDRNASVLRAAIGDGYGQAPERVFAANGSNEVLQCALLAYGGPGRRALVFEPTYALHSHISRVTGTEVVARPRGDDHRLGVDDALAAVDEVEPDVVFLCSPNNPTGTMDPPDTVSGVLERAGALGFLLIVDEAYGQFSPETAIDLIDDGSPMLVTRTFSKTWSMAAARLGYGIGPAWVVEALEGVALPYHLDALTQAAGVAALGCRDEMHERVAAIVEERGRLSAALAELDVDVWPSGANFVLFRPRAVDGHDVWTSLVARSILVRDCSSWPGIEGCLRVTIGRPEENDAFVDALKEIL